VQIDSPSTPVQIDSPSTPQTTNINGMRIDSPSTPQTTNINGMRIDSPSTPLQIDDMIPSITALEAAEDQRVIAALVAKIEADPWRQRWDSLRDSLPRESVPFETRRDADDIGTDVNNLTAIQQTIARLQHRIDSSLYRKPYPSVVKFYPDEVLVERRRARLTKPSNR
jgi:hypothetical protein